MNVTEGSGQHPAATERTRPSLEPAHLPTGTLTFFFSDIEGSTRLVNALGPGFTPVLERHQALVREAVGAAGGIEIATEGDSFFVVFTRAAAAVEAAIGAQRAIAREPWPVEVGTLRVRMGLHTGEGTLGGDNYVGLDVHRAARIMAAAHGGQVLVSETTRSLVAGSLPQAATLRDLGEHRLKDLVRPERLFQVVAPGLDEGFPAPRSLEVPSNLPPELSPFVGRQSELDEITRLARESRLLTLTGPGGTGKTRLGLQLIHRLRHETPDGVFFVDLSPITDPSLVASTIAGTLGIREEPSRPVLESLTAHVRDLRMRLLLDNFEQLLEAATIVAELLRAGPALAIIVTSREGLHIRGELEFAVPPLAIPDPDRLPPIESLVGFDAVALFAQRAAEVDAGFRINEGNARSIAAICARLDGLPLAIELAAARVKVLSPGAILARLERRLPLLTTGSRDLPARQRTLRAAIDWSFELLPPSEQVLFRRLGAFVGSWSLEAAEAVSGPGTELDLDLLDGLSSLVDKSLVRRTTTGDGEPRFGMLETIREYALDRLEASPEVDAVRRRHEEYFGTLASRASMELLGSHSKAWLDLLDADRDNLRAALQHAADEGRIEQALGLAAALWRFWLQRGHLAEGRMTLEGLLERPEAASPTRARALALGALGGVVYWQGDVPNATRIYVEALELVRGLDDPGLLADALYDRGFVGAVSGERGLARSAYEESLAIFERLGDPPGVVRVREALVFLMFHEGDFETACALQEENVRAYREAGEIFRVANSLSLLSAIQIRAGRHAGAHASQVEAVRIFRETGDLQGSYRVLILASALAHADGDAIRSARLRGAADGIKEQLGEVASPMQLLGIEDPAVAAEARLGATSYAAEYAAGRALTLDRAAELISA